MPSGYFERLRGAQVLPFEQPQPFLKTGASLRLSVLRCISCAERLRIRSLLLQLGALGAVRDLVTAGDLGGVGLFARRYRY